jgi:hypothetical protein
MPLPNRHRAIVGSGRRSSCRASSRADDQVVVAVLKLQSLLAVPSGALLEKSRTT